MPADELHLSPESALHHDELLLDHQTVMRSVQRWPLVLLTLLLAMAIGVVALLFNGVLGPRKANTGDLTVELGPMPSVDPVTLKPVSADLAKEMNALIPVTASVFPAAQPFVIGQSGSDADRAADCLAATIYYEAALESLEGQMAVAQVVLNRVRHPAFPKSVCSVVFQGSERRTGCQFSFTCDGSMARRKPSTEMWARTRGIATSMLAGGVYAPVGNATHYHADYVVPYWASSLEKLRVEGSHIFYRWAGGWGSSKAFVGKYAGREAGLVAAKPVEAVALGINGLPLSDAPIVPLDAKIVAKSIATGATTAADIERGQYILRADPGLDPSQLPLLAQQACGERDYCKVLAWSDPKTMPKGFPIPVEQLSTMSFSYLRIKGQGFEKALWNCAVFPRPDKKHCIRERIVEEKPLPKPKVRSAEPALQPEGNATSE
jgi:spore germination cell wall hydrolase CwlJ-like protein